MLVRGLVLILGIWFLKVGVHSERETGEANGVERSVQVQAAGSRGVSEEAGGHESQEKIPQQDPREPISVSLLRFEGPSSAFRTLVFSSH